MILLGRLGARQDCLALEPAVIVERTQLRVCSDAFCMISTAWCLHWFALPVLFPVC